MQGTIKSSGSRALVILGGAFPGPAVCHPARHVLQMVRSRETRQRGLDNRPLSILMHNTGEEKSAFPKSFFLPVPSSRSSPPIQKAGGALGRGRGGGGLGLGMAEQCG